MYDIDNRLKYIYELKIRTNKIQRGAFETGTDEVDKCTIWKAIWKILMWIYIVMWTKKRT